MLSASDVVRDARTSCGLSQRALARAAGVAQSTVARIETGRLDPTWSMMASLLGATQKRPAPTPAGTPAVSDYVDVLTDRDGSGDPVVLARLRADGAMDAAGRIIDPARAMMLAGEACPLSERGGTVLRSPDGPTAWLQAAVGLFPGLVVTGGFAANQLVRTTDPVQAVVYLPPDVAPSDVVAATGAKMSKFGDVLLLPPDPAATRQSTMTRGVRWAWPWRVAADCATAPGRSPAAGRAVAELLA